MTVGAPLGHPGVVVVDPASVTDLVGAWNLRAAGNDVALWPAHDEFFTHALFQAWLERQEGRGWSGIGGDRQVWIWTRNDEEVPSDLAAALPTDDVQHFVTPLSHVAHDSRGSIVHSAHARRFSVEFDPHLGEYNVPLPSLDFLPRRARRHALGYVAADIEPYGARGLPEGWALVVPALRALAPALRPFPRPAEPFIRPARRSITRAVEADDEDIAVPVVQPDRVTSTVFTAGDMATSFSGAGRHATRLIEILGGAGPDSLANQPAAREVLRSATRSPNGKPAQALRQVALDHQGAWSSSRVFGYRQPDYVTPLLAVLASRTLRSRLSFQCTSCGVPNSLGMPSVQDSVTCEFCGAVTNLATLLVRKHTRWLLSTARTLTTERLDELFPVMASLSALRCLFDPNGDTLHVVGLDVEAPEARCELDLVMVTQDFDHPLVVVGEAKAARSHLDDADFDHLEHVQRQLRRGGIDAYILVAVMRAELSELEVTRLRRMCDLGLEAISSRASHVIRPVCPIILTRPTLSVPSDHADHPLQLVQRHLPRVPALALETCRLTIGLETFDMEPGPGVNYRLRARWSDTDDAGQSG